MGSFERAGPGRGQLGLGVESSRVGALPPAALPTEPTLRPKMASRPSSMSQRTLQRLDEFDKITFNMPGPGQLGPELELSRAVSLPRAALQTDPTPPPKRASHPAPISQATWQRLEDFVFELEQSSRRKELKMQGRPIDSLTVVCATPDTPAICNASTPKEAEELGRVRYRTKSESAMTLQEAELLSLREHSTVQKEMIHRLEGSLQALKERAAQAEAAAAAAMEQAAGAAAAAEAAAAAAAASARRSNPSTPKDNLELWSRRVEMQWQAHAPPTSSFSPIRSDCLTGSPGFICISAQAARGGGAAE